jgi:hypothetical protein
MTLMERTRRRRLRRRMEAAMAEAGEEETDEDLSGEEQDEEDEDEDEEMASFHTASDEDGEDDNDDDGSETLEDGPVDEKTRVLRAKMQAMMEAAERRALGDETTPGASKASKKKAVNPKGNDFAEKGILKSSQPAQQAHATENEDEEAAWDLTPGVIGKPLSAKVLKAAAKAEEEKRRLAGLKQEEARRRKLEVGERRKKRRKHMEKEVTRVVS